VLAGILIGAIHLSYHGTGIVERIRKTAGIVMSTAGLLALVAYLEALPPGAHVAWQEDYASARALALQNKQPLFVDFGASWCGACGELDRHTFADPRVVREAERFVAVRVDLSPDQDSPEKRAVLASYEQRGLPLVVLHGSDGEEAARVTSFVKADEFLELMQEVQ
jgi:thiol:disulfide interchange protein DsbD